MPHRSKSQLLSELGEVRRQLDALQQQMAHAFPFCPGAEESSSQVAVQDGRPASDAAQRALQESEQRFRMLAGAAFEAIAIGDADHVIEANDQFEQMHGYGPRETIGMPIRSFIAPEDWPTVQANRQCGFEEPYQYTAITRDGERRVVEARGKAIPYQGRMVRVTALRDLTAARRAEEALRQSEARFKRVVESNMLGIAFWDIGGAITDANDALLHLLGYSRADLQQGRVRWDALTPEEYLPLDYAAIEQIKQTGVCTPFEKEYFHANGSRIPVLVGGAALDGEPCHGVCFVLDIRDRRVAERTADLAAANQRLQCEVAQRQQAEQRLHAQSGILRSILNTMSDAVVVTDASGRLLLVNPAGARIMNLQLVGNPPVEWVESKEIHVPSLPSAYSHDQRPLIRALRGETVIEAQAFIRHEQIPDGAWISGNAQPLLDQRGQIAGAVVVFRDISERRLQETRLRSSEEQFRQLAENIREVFWIVDVGRSYEVVYLSPAFEEVWGFPPADVLAEPERFMAAIHPDDQQRMIAAFRELSAVGFDEEYRIVRPDGGVRMIRTRGFPLHNEAGQVYRITGISEDVTQAREAEQQLLHEQRLMRRLLAVHERERQWMSNELHDRVVQNVFGGLLQLEALEQRLHNLWPEGCDRLADASRPLRDAMNEARHMISVMRPPIIDERGLVPAIAYLVSEFVPGGVEVEFVHNVEVERLDPQLEAAVFRIAQDAWNSVCRHSQSTRVTVTLVQHGDWLRLVVCDSGAGFQIDSDDERALGLRSIRERVRLFGGRTQLQSDSAGTCLTIEMPIEPHSWPE